MNERDIFQAAVEIENPSERASFLEEACQNQPGLRNHVESLLKHYDDAGSFLERPPAEFEQTQVFDEQATDENSLAPLTHSPDARMSDETLRSYLTPSDSPGVLGLLGEYEILEKIGQGGMGVVLKAKDTKLERIVAIKLLAPELASNPMARKRFSREAKAAAAVTHDHVVRIYAVSDSPQMPMLVMEYIDGQSLQQKLDKTGALEIKEILRIGLQAALGLAAAHKQGLVHRDIKPANILLENGIERVKITDFGLARAVDDIGMTTTGQITGTPQYMSPEQAQGEAVDYRSDLFSLGSVMYAMCTGRAAFRADSTVAVLRRVCDDDPRPIREIHPEIPEVLADIVEQLMEKNPEHRFQSAQEVAEALSALLAQIQQPGYVLSTPLAKSPKAKPGGQRFPGPSAPLPLGKLFLVLGILFMGFCVSEATGVTRLASTIIRIISGEGTLIIETNDTSLQVTVEGQGSRQEVRVTGVGVNLTLKPGEYKVTASNKDGKTVQQNLVTITRNGKNVVRISYEGGTEAAAKPDSTDPGALDASSLNPMGQELLAASRVDLTTWGTFVDPLEDCRLAREQNAVTITVPGNQAHTLNPLVDKNAYAPRLWEQVTGDFTVEVHVPKIAPPYRKTATHGGASYRAAGLVVWQDQNTFLRLEQAGFGEWADGARYVHAEWFGEGKLLGDEGEVVPDPTHLRIVRKGPQFEFCLRQESGEWMTWRKSTLNEIGETLHVGIAVINSTNETFAPRLENLTLKTNAAALPSSDNARAKTASAGDSDLPTLTEVRQLQGHRGPVKQVAFSPDGKLAVSGSGWPAGDRSVRIWDVETGTQLRTSGTLPQQVMAVGFSPDGKLIAAGGFDGQIHIRETATGEFRYSLPGHTEVVEDVIFSPDGKTVLSIGHKRAYMSDTITIPDHGTAVLWELESQKLLWRFDLPTWLKAGGFSPDGERVYVSGYPTEVAVLALDAKTGKETERYRTNLVTRGAEELAVSPDGQFLATASGSGAVHVWNINDPTKPLEQQLDSQRLLTISYTSDGSHLVTGGHAGIIHVLNAKTLEVVASHHHPSGSVWHLAVSPVSSHILTAGGSIAEGETMKGSGDYALRLWQLPASLFPR